MWRSQSDQLAGLSMGIFIHYFKLKSMNLYLRIFKNQSILKLKEDMLCTVNKDKTRRNMNRPCIMDLKHSLPINCLQRQKTPT